MKTRPMIIWVLSSLGFLTLPLFVLFQTNYLQKSLDLVLSYPLTWIVSFSFVASIGILKVRLWGYFSFMAFSLTCVSYLFYDYLQVPSTYNYTVLLASSITMAAFSFLVQKHISAPYFNPQIRWWERDPRYRVNLQAEFQVNETPCEGTLLDLSRSGCFVDLTHELVSGDVVTVKITLLNYDFKSTAKVVWKHSGGYGLMFVAPDKSVKKMLKYLAEISGEHHTINQGLPVQ